MVKELLKNIPIPLAGIGLSLLFDLAQGIWKGIKQKTIKQISQAGPIHEQSSPDEIRKTTEIFEEYKEQIYRESEKIERAVYEEVQYYLEGLDKVLDENEKLLNGYGIRVKRLDRKQKELLSGIKREFDHEISIQMSLANVDCRKVMEMRPGARKERAISDLLYHVIKSALEQCGENIRSVMEEIFEDIQEDIMEAVDQIAKNAENAKRTLGEIEAEHREESAEKTAEGAVRSIAVYDQILEGMEV